MAARLLLKGIRRARGMANQAMASSINLLKGSGARRSSRKRATGLLKVNLDTAALHLQRRHRRLLVTSQVSNRIWTCLGRRTSCVRR